MTEKIEIKHDGQLSIATGRSRKETSWNNRDTTWSAFLNKVKNTHRTVEPYAEYMSVKKPRQDEIKDVGGFVGGYLANGQRKNGSVMYRSMLALDIDYGKDDTLSNIEITLMGVAYCVYSTHKHCPESKRLRVIIPVDREMTVEEYEAIARLVAADIDIELFDDTTYEPTRLMYWPSSSKDGEYVFDYNDAPWLCADKYLSRYHNWKDSSEWPVSSRTQDIVHREVKQQEDPCEKTGIIGSFCRTYDIHAAIEKFLPEVYEPCDVENRYTYLGGSTSAGMIVYDDKFAYSHHGTDPSGGKLCNAFDLVRIHKYHLKDEGCHQDTPVGKRPSYVAMCDLAAKDPDVRITLVKDRNGSAGEDFAEYFEEIPTPVENGVENLIEEDNDWMGKMEADKNGKIKSTVNNVLLVLRNDPRVRRKLALDEFRHREVALGKLPWRAGGVQPYLVDADDSGLRWFMEYYYEITGETKIRDGVATVINENKFHPVRNYLNDLGWDGVKRIDTILIDYLGAEDSDYVRAVSRKFMVAAVRRVFEPGCKFDYVPVLQGPQGSYKSTFIKNLGREWYSDSFTTVQGTSAYEQVQGVWLLEMGELAGLKKAEVNAIKHFISKQEDQFRPAYGRKTEIFKRQCIFIGTTNEDEFLSDSTGNRRFWPVKVAVNNSRYRVDEDMTDYLVGQLWGEAVYLYKAGETTYFDRETEELAKEQQSQHTEEDDRIGIIIEYLNTPITEDWVSKELYERRNYYLDPAFRNTGTVPRNRVSVAEIWYECFKRDIADMTTFNTKKIHSIMKNLNGWEPRNSKKSRCGPYGLQKTYERNRINLEVS